MNTFGMAFAQTAPAAQPAAGGGWVSFLPIILMIVIFYFLLIRPQQKKEKDRRKMIAALQNGDRVLTTGGIYGVVSAVKENDIIVLKVSDNTKIEIARSAVQLKIQ